MPATRPASASICSRPPSRPGAVATARGGVQPRLDLSYRRACLHHRLLALAGPRRRRWFRTGDGTAIASPSSSSEGSVAATIGGAPAEPRRIRGAKPKANQGTLL